jgi:hypothetical protein
MSAKKPLVIENGQLQQIQSGQEVDDDTLPYNKEDHTRKLLRMLIAYMVAQGFDDMPEDLLAELEGYLL